MFKKGQRTGIFDLDNVNQISLKSKGKEETRDVKINAPRLMIDASSIKRKNGKVDIEQALKVVEEQMKISGIRNRTIKEYLYTFRRYTKTMNLENVDEINTSNLYEWLSSLGEITDITRQSRLRTIKAILNRFYTNGYSVDPFWRDMKIKVDTKVKPAADESNLSILLSLLDMTNFIHFRDAVAILTIYQCGLRMSSLVQLKETDIDFDNYVITLQGDIMKGRDILKLPINEELATYLKRLIDQNNIIRKHYRKRNKFIFISRTGDSLHREGVNAITKRMSYYSKKYGLYNINPHAIRRLFAMRLMREGANVALISKALGHKSLSTTTYYLGITTDQVVNDLREFL